MRFSSRIVKLSLVFLLVCVVLTRTSLADIVIPSTRDVIINRTLLAVLVNYLWNFLILGILFYAFKVKVVDVKFFLFVFSLTSVCLFPESVGFVLLAGRRILFFVGVTILLFAVSFGLSKLFYGFSARRCTIVGIVYAIFSNPIVGMLLLRILTFPLVRAFF